MPSANSAAPGVQCQPCAAPGRASCTADHAARRLLKLCARTHPTPPQVRDFFGSLPCWRGVPNDAVFHLHPTSWFAERVGWWFARPYVDIYGIRHKFMPSGSKIYLVGTEQQVHMRVDELFPINRTALVVAGRRFAGPRNTEAVLEALYGAGWSTPDPWMLSSTPR